MATYTAITNGQIDQDSPITQPLMTALRDNPIAMAEGDSSAPKFATQAQVAGTFATTSGGTAVFTNLDDYAGVEFKVLVREGTGTDDQDVTIEYSTNNGSTWSTPAKIGHVRHESTAAIAMGYFNFSDGTLVSICDGAAGDPVVQGFFANTTMAGASNNINALRFSCDTIAVILNPNGGIV